MTAIGKDSLDRLLARGRERGQVTTEDLRRELPVEAMSPEDIAVVVVHLEERGVAVELEESLLARTGGSPGISTRGDPELVLPPDRRDPPAPGPPQEPGGLMSGTPAPAAAEPPRGLRAVHWAVVAAGLATLLLLFLLFAG